MKNRRGFTLAELLGVIILLGIVSAAIAVPILTQINMTSSELSKASAKLIYNNAELYMTRYSNTYKKNNGNIYYITIEQLQNSGLLEEDFLESYTEDVLTKDSQIKVTIKNNSYRYEMTSEQISNISDIYDSLSITSTYSYAGGTYIKGDYENNYVWYNGFYWRIMGKNIDGTIRLIMDEDATTLMYYDEANYSTSYVRDWLNDYFISRLQYNGVIAKEKWFFNSPSSASNVTVNSNVYIEDKVGLLSLEEFNLSLTNSSSYLKKGCTGLLNQNNALFYSTCTSNNLVMADSNDMPMTVRPIINVYGSTIVSAGTGSYSSPYLLAEYETSKIGLTLGEANLSIGTQIMIDSKSYRIVEKNVNSIKIVSTDTPTLFSNYASANNTFNLANGAGYALHNPVISGLFLKSNVFLGKIYQMGDNYRNTVFAKVNIVYDTFSSLPVMGEMFTAPIFNNEDEMCFWTLNMSSSTEAYQICDDGSVISKNISTYDANQKSQYGLRYTANISLDNVIQTEGNGSVCLSNC